LLWFLVLAFGLVLAENHSIPGVFLFLAGALASVLAMIVDRGLP
jgi:hypothetical protein